MQSLHFLFFSSLLKFYPLRWHCLQLYLLSFLILCNLIFIFFTSLLIFFHLRWHCLRLPHLSLPYFVYLLIPCQIFEFCCIYDFPSRSETRSSLWPSLWAPSSGSWSPSSSKPCLTRWAASTSSSSTRWPASSSPSPPSSSSQRWPAGVRRRSQSSIAASSFASVKHQKFKNEQIMLQTLMCQLLLKLCSRIIKS